MSDENEPTTGDEVPTVDDDGEPTTPSLLDRMAAARTVRKERKERESSGAASVDHELVLVFATEAEQREYSVDADYPMWIPELTVAYGETAKQALGNASTYGNNHRNALLKYWQAAGRTTRVHSTRWGAVATGESGNRAVRANWGLYLSDAPEQPTNGETEPTTDSATGEPPADESTGETEPTE